MKTITITIEVEELKSNNTFASELLKEMSNEKKQFDITKKINQETTELLSKIMDSYVKDLNTQLEGLDCKFERTYHETLGKKSNHMVAPYAILVLNGYSWGIRLNPISEKSELSKYVTYFGKYDIEAARLPSKCFSANNEFSRVKDLNHLLEKAKFDIKKHIN